MIKREQLKLYAITDSSWLNGDTLAHQVELAIAGGATIVQLREKNKSKDEREAGNTIWTSITGFSSINTKNYIY